MQIPQLVFLSLELLFNILAWLIIIRVLTSWVRGLAAMPGARFIADVTDPVLRFFHKIIPPISGIDLSPLWAILALDILRSIFHSLSGGG